MFRDKAVAVAIAAALFGCGSGDRGPKGPKVIRHVPTDDRPAVQSATPPPAISGGTLLVTREGRWAVAADPDRDRVSVVDLRERRVLYTIPLSAGDEPGRVAEDQSGLVHVALRRGGDVVAIDYARGTVVSRRSVCGAPRGIAYDALNDTVHVACKGGELVSLPAEGGEATRRLELGSDLRDVVVQGDKLFVTRFKSAELIEVDAASSIGSVRRPTAIEQLSFQPVAVEVERRPGSRKSVEEPVSFEPTKRPMSPAVAWRAFDAGSGRVAMLHQYGFDGEIDLEPDESSDALGLDSSYGGAGDPCAGLVRSGISRFDPDGEVIAGMPLLGGALTVDAAISPDGQWAIVAHAGTQDPGAPQPFVEFVNDGPHGGASSGGGFAGGPGAFFSLGGVSVMQIESVIIQPGQEQDVPECGFPDITAQVNGQTTAVAFNPAVDVEARQNGPWFIAQTREPATLAFFDTGDFEPSTVVDLGGESMFDTGHEIFHRNSGAGVSCASCHSEGGDDGRVWRFSPIGDRRTQSVDVGLAGTAPFHWDGDMHDLSTLMEEVFVGRMGGARQSDERLRVLSEWVFGLEPPARIVAEDDPAAVRGRALFESKEVGCNDCHTGPKHTNNQSYEVGTTAAGHLLQVPSLVAVGYRAPFLHTGCATTLGERFDPACGGGDRHGKTSQLSPAELGDLIAYLESL